MNNFGGYRPWEKRNQETEFINDRAIIILSEISSCPFLWTTQNLPSLALFSAGGTVGIWEMCFSNHNLTHLFRLLLQHSMRAPPPRPMLCANPTCTPFRLHEGLRLQPSLPVDTANTRTYFLGCSQSCSSCKAFSTSRNIISSQLWFKLAFDEGFFCSRVYTNPCRVSPRICSSSPSEFVSPALSWNASGLL